MPDVTLRKCEICGEKTSGRLDMFKHLKEDHTQHERLEALMENIEPGPRYSKNG